MFNCCLFCDLCCTVFVSFGFDDLLPVISCLLFGFVSCMFDLCVMVVMYCKLLLVYAFGFAGWLVT